MVLLLAACGDDSQSAAERSTTTLPDEFRAERCLVYVHGRSDVGAPPEQLEDYAVISPDSNESYSGGGGVWIYDTEESLQEALDILVDAVDRAGCESVVLHGFSNGAAFVGALVCTGDDFDGRLVGAVIDDPVPDDSSPDCAPAAGVERVVYWTGALDADAAAGESCDALGWTCAGSDELVGIDEYARRLGVPVTPSPNEEHEPYRSAAEPGRWLTAS